MPIETDSFPSDPIRRLEAIMSALRGPEGCPWDREQDHKSLRTNLLEETYEVLDVLDMDEEIDTARLVEELGDLLLQIIFHAQLGAERSDFDLDSIASAINEKLISRHPHVFNTTAVSGTGEVLRNWERLKLKEGKESALDGVPGSLPALLRAAHLLSKAERAGFRWRSRDQALSKVREEWEEVEEAIARAGEGTEEATSEVEKEFGDVLLAMVSTVFEFGIDPEAALRGAARRFEDRFRRMETSLPDDGVKLEGLDTGALLDLWNESQEEGSSQESPEDFDS